MIGQAGLRSGRTVITRREIAGAANQVHVMLIQPLTYYEEPLTRCLNTFLLQDRTKYILKVPRAAYIVTSGLVSAKLAIWSCKFSSVNETHPWIGMYDCKFLFYIQFFFYFIAYALPVVCRYNEIRGTGLFRGILNCLNRKKKIVRLFYSLELVFTIFSVYSKAGAHYRLFRKNFNQ